MRAYILGLLLLAVAACAPEQPVYQGPSYYQREMDKQVPLDDPARPKRLDKGEFLQETRQYNGNPNPTAGDEFMERYQYRLLDTIGNAARY